MRRKTTSIFILSLCICVFVLLPIYAFEDAATQTTFVNPQRGTTQTYTDKTPETAFSSFEVTFAKNLDTLAVKTKQSDKIPASMAQLPQVYRYYNFGATDTTAIEKMTIIFGLERSNSLSLTPANVALYGYTTKYTWALIPSSVSYTTSTHYYFKATVTNQTKFVIANIQSVETTKPTQTQQNSSASTTTSATKPVAPTNKTTTQTATKTPREYVDDTNKPNYILIGIILTVIVGAIGATIALVIAKRKVGPTKIQAVDTLSLKQEITTSIASGKTNGQIVDALLDKGHSLNSIMSELKKAGRTR